MRSMFWLGVAGLALLSAPAWSQQQRPPDLTVAPNAPNKQTETSQAQGAAGRPANICQELVTYLEQQAAKKAEGGQQGAPQAAQQPAKPQQPAQAAQQPAPSGANPSTGQTAPAVDKPQHSSGQAAPIPHDGKASEGPTIPIEQARAMKESKDLRACQEATRRLRKAGIALPPSLLALAALRDDLLAKSKTD